MKRFFLSFAVFVCFLLFILGCSFNNGKDSYSNCRVKIVTTMFPHYDFARQITKNVDGVRVKMLIPPGVDAHSFEPSAGDIREVKDADLFIYTGGENDVWVDRILKSLKKSSGSCLSFLDIFKDDGDVVLNSSGCKFKDEHVWTSLPNCVKIVKCIANKICEIDKENGTKYNENMGIYLKELNRLNNSFKDVVANRKRDILVFADRFPFLYFVNCYGLKYITPYSGCSSNTDVGSLDVSNVVKVAKRENVPLILKLEQSSGALSKTIADEVGAKVKVFYSCHNCSKEDFKNGKTFLNFIEENVKTLKEALC